MLHNMIVNAFYMYVHIALYMSRHCIKYEHELWHIECVVLCVYIAVDHSLSIVSRIDQFYCDVKQRRKEMFGNNEPSFDPRYT